MGCGINDFLGSFATANNQIDFAAIDRVEAATFPQFIDSAIHALFNLFNGVSGFNVGFFAEIKSANGLGDVKDVGFGPHFCGEGNPLVKSTSRVFRKVDRDKDRIHILHHCLQVFWGLIIRGTKMGNPQNLL